jgi:hypothetical protein
MRGPGEDQEQEPPPRRIRQRRSGGDHHQPVESEPQQLRRLLESGQFRRAHCHQLRWPALFPCYLLEVTDEQLKEDAR